MVDCYYPWGLIMANIFGMLALLVCSLGIAALIWMQWKEAKGRRW